MLAVSTISVECDLRGDRSISTRENTFVGTYDITISLLSSWLNGSGHCAVHSGAIRGGSVGLTLARSEGERHKGERNKYFLHNLYLSSQSRLP